MFKKAIFSFCLFSFFSLNASVNQNTESSERTPPSWVKPNDFSVEAVPAKPSQTNLQYLLIDTQRNLEEKTYYYHIAVKVLTQGGTELISQIKVDFDPSCTQVVMHDIRIFREGEWHDRLKNARHNLIQRETDLERNLYHGDLTLVYFLSDIREGDIVEYAYSLVGESLLASSYYTDRIHLQRSAAIEKITHRLLADPNLFFSTKLVNTEVNPQVRDLTPSLREWKWEVTETPPYVRDQDQPIWYGAPAYIQTSQYRSWGEVIQNLLPLYDLPEDFFVSVPSEMQCLIREWQESSNDLSRQALLALRFVQDEIRYLGFEEGMGAFKPTDPRITFQRRFGDCKDKTFLLHALLRLIGIPSKVALVHADRGKRLPIVLPTPFVFNHLVLQLEIEGKTYWVDPTWNLQGGALDSTHFPDYEWGLILAENISELIPLPKPVVKSPTEIDTQLTVMTEDSACLTLKSIFYGASADKLRRSLKWRGSKKISENSLSHMQEIYGGVSLNNPIEVLDDRDSNSITLVESYSLPTQAIHDKKTIEVFSHTLRNYLGSSINPQRSSPYAITYPLWVKEKVHIETPFMQLASFKENFSKAHGALFFDCSVEVEGNNTFFNFELKHLQDHIPKKSLHDYWEMINEIRQKGYPTITVTPSHSFFTKVSWVLLSSALALIAWFLIYFLSRKKRPTLDELRFHLQRSQVLYTFLNIFSLMALGFEVPLYMILQVIVIPMVFVYFIIIKRSIPLIFILQGCLLLQTCAIGLFLFVGMLDIHLSHRFIAISIYSLYSTTIFIALNKAKKCLNQERKAKAINNLTTL